ncbi:MAG: MFS transporter [Kiloniellaceae bacterium]
MTPEPGEAGKHRRSRLGRRFLATFAALRHRNYRLLWIGTLISQTGDWMDQIALNWLVLQITGSPAYLGLVNFFRGTPILFFALLGGVAADRIERRYLMMMTQGASMVLAFVLAGLVIFDAADVWLLIVVATCRGIVISFNLPARHTLVSELVPREDLPNAVALTSLTLNITKVIGPLIAGVVIGAIGVSACFLINGISFVAVLGTLWAMDLPKKPRRKQTETLGQSLVGGFAYINRHTAIRLLVLVALIPMFFGQPYLTMLTVFADSVYRIGPEGLGLLVSCAAAGSVCGALLVATFSSAARRGVVMLGFLLVYGCALVAFSLNDWFALAPVLLMVAGAMQIAYNASNNAMLQMAVPDEVRGRVLSTLFLNRGLVSMGTAFVGFLAALVGPQTAMASTTAVVAATAVLLFLFSPTMRGFRV